MKKDKNWVVKGISAPEEWWAQVEEAQDVLGIDSRSNLIRIAVDDYLKDCSVDNRHILTPA